MTITVARARELELQYIMEASKPCEGATNEEARDEIKRFNIAWSLIRGLHDYSVINVPGVNYYDGNHSIIYSPRRKR